MSSRIGSRAVNATQKSEECPVLASVVVSINLDSRLNILFVSWTESTYVGTSRLSIEPTVWNFSAKWWITNLIGRLRARDFVPTNKNFDRFDNLNASGNRASILDDLQTATEYTRYVRLFTNERGDCDHSKLYRSYWKILYIDALTVSAQCLHNPC